MQDRTLRKLHQESWELIPWYITGQLDEAQTQRIQQHLADCELCRHEHASQLLLRQHMRRGDSVLYAPHASLQKLLNKIEHEDSASSTVADSARPPAPFQQHAKWLAVAVIVEAIALVLAIGTLAARLQQERAAPRYSTLTTASPVIAQQPAARAVFAPTASVAELGELLRTHGAIIIDGPTEAGVFTLGFPSAGNEAAVSAAIARLRMDSRVRLVELVSPSGTEK